MPSSHSRPAASASAQFGHQADADDHEVRGHLRAVRALDGVDAVVAEQAAHACVRQHVDAVARVLRLVEAAHLGRDDAIHHAVHHLDDRHVEPELAEGRRALEADVARADDRDAHAGLACFARIASTSAIVRSTCTPGRSAPGTGIGRAWPPIASTSLS